MIDGEKWKVEELAPVHFVLFCEESGCPAEASQVLTTYRELGASHRYLCSACLERIREKSEAQP